jgi:hypothetical protein
MPSQEEPTPMWVMVVEVLREFPRTIDTILWGIETYYGCVIPAHILSAELCRLTFLGFVAMTDSSAEPLMGYKLTDAGLHLQAANTENCVNCGTELVFTRTGWCLCGHCNILFWVREWEGDNLQFWITAASDILKLTIARGGKLPPIPQDIPVCLPVPASHCN